jgi:phosphate transport system substrate-binding protein
VAGDTRRLILTPRNCRDAYAYWELPEAEVAALRRQNYPMALKLHDVTDIADVDRQPPHSTQQFTCDAVAVGDYHMPVDKDDRDYLVELGYLGANDTWHALARSSHVRVPACPNTGGHLPATTAIAAATAGAVATAAAPTPTIPARVVFAARDCRHGYAYWELPQAQVSDLLAQGRSLRLRLYDVTELPGQVVGKPNNVQEFEANLTAQGDLHLPVAVDDRDYLVELGYSERAGDWHVLAKSEPVRVPVCPDAATAAASGQGVSRNLTSPLTGAVADAGAGLGRSVTDISQGVGKVAGAAVAGGAAAVAGVGAATGALFGKATEAVQSVTPGMGSGSRTDMGAESKIILVPRSADAAYAYWEVAEVHRDALKAEGGRTLALRIHDATNLELDYQTPHSTQEYVLADSDRDKHVPIFVPDRDYVAELGYLTDQGNWLQLIRSLHVRVPAA